MSHDGTVTPMQEELPQEKEELIQALLLYGSTRGAAKQLNISERTAWRWQSDPLFKRRYKEERLARFERSVAIAQQTSEQDRKSTRLNSSHANSSYAVFCLKKK